MKRFSLFAVLTLILLTSACSDGPKPLETVVEGRITVADTLDKSGDYSGISITIITRDSTNAQADTLFTAKTNQEGYFSGKVRFPEKRYYNMFVSRNKTVLGNAGVILAEGDTLSITSELPAFNENLMLDSREHEAIKTLSRVDRSFQRVSAFARRGAIPDSQIVDELKKWSDLYWEVFEKYDQTIAAYLAAEKSAGLLSTFRPDAMMNRIDAALPEDYMISVALKLGQPYIAEAKGFDAASGYLDSLAVIAESETAREVVERSKIKMYFDSSRVKEAKQLLTIYEDHYQDKPSSKKWARRIRYDLNYLAPGVSVPDFSFITMSGDTVTNNKLKGTTYILEISPLASIEYQNDYDRTLIIHEIYKNYGLNIFTIPLDQNETTINAFFDERRKIWSVAKLGTFDFQDIIQKFNIVQVPTRFLVDEEGVLIRKYERGEFEDVIQGLNQAFRNSKNPS